MSQDHDEHAEAGPSHRAQLCPLCERRLLRAAHCKLVCDGCGYVESCEDNFVPNQMNPDDQRKDQDSR
ncbi:MAG: hypothetical protein J5J06_07760 [Phycisphaerae bacterium]|nr:hypothetical protein [Phycisphaerae bacterium]